MKYLYLISLSLILSLSSCIYRMDIEQGNAVDAEKADQLKLGMSKKQVQFLLGKAAIEDQYHANKWHYLRALKSENGFKKELKTLVLSFEDEQLINIKGSLK